MDFKNQLLMLLMIKAYNVSFYTLLCLISAYYAKDLNLPFLSFLYGKEHQKQEQESTYNAAVKSNTNELNKSASISIEIFLHKQNDTLAHS